MDDRRWIEREFEGAALGDARRSERLVQVAVAMMRRPGQSLPKQQHGRWSDVKAGYRLLSNPAVDASAMQQPHRERTWQRCREQAVVLIVQDDTELDFSKRAARGSVSGMGRLAGPGYGRGLYQHTALAVDPVSKRLLGIVDQRWWARQESRKGETRRQRQARWSEADRWADVAEALDDHREAWDTTRMIHVGDRGSDVWRFLHRCGQLGQGFVVRAKHDRYADAERCQTLRQRLADQPVRGTRELKLQRQRKSDGAVTRQPREASVSLRYTTVTLPPPTNDPRTADAPPVRATAIHIREDDPPEQVKPRERVDWLLLTDQPVSDTDAAWRVVGYYQQRWVIEEFHRCEKEGCGIERSRLDHAEDIQRLAAIKSVVALRLLQTRDAADDPDRAHDPEATKQLTTPSERWVVGQWTGLDPDTLTPRQFYHAVAKEGGWLARKHDGRPGWTTLHRGMYDLRVAAELIPDKPPPTCG